MSQVGMSGDTFSLKEQKSVLKRLLPLLKGNSLPEEVFFAYSLCS